MIMFNQSYSELKSAALGGKIDVKNYYENMAGLLSQNAVVEKFLNAKIESIIKLTSIARILSEDRPVFSTLTKFFNKSRYTDGLNIRLPKTIKTVRSEIDKIQKNSEKDIENISYTFVSGLFMVYTKFLCVLEGVYFLDPAPKTKEASYNKHVFPFSKFLLEYLPNFSTP